MQFCKIFLPILVLALSSCLREKQPEPPKAEKGILDLRGWKDGRGLSLGNPLSSSVNLDGEWEFYWKEFVPPSDGIKQKGNTGYTPAYITVPGNWNDFEIEGKTVGGKGYATYRLRVLTDSPKNPTGNHTLQEKTLGLKLLSVSTSYKLFVNGKLITEVGRIGKTEEEAVPDELPQVVSIPADGQETEILFQASNFKYAKGGIWYSVKIGNLQELQKEREKNLFLDFFLFGSLLLMGVYHLGLFVLRRKDKSPLYFGLFSLLMGIRPFFSVEEYLYSSLPWSLALQIAFLTFFLGTPIFLLFLSSIFPDEVPKWTKPAVIISSGFLSICLFFLPTFYYTRIVRTMEIIMLFTIAVSIYAMGLAISRKRPGSLSFLSGFFIFAVIITNDILNSRDILYTGYYGPYGFLVFVFSQAFFLSMRSSQAFNQVEKFTETLENKIEERTRDLEIARQRTEELNLLIKSLNEELDLKLLMQKVHRYVRNFFGIQQFALYIVNSEKTHLELLDAAFPDFLSEDDRQIVLNIRIPIFAEKGAHKYVFSSNRPFFIPNVHTKRIMNDAAEEELFIIEKCRNQSFLMIPLILNGQPIGILDLSNSTEKMELSREDITRLSILGEQLAGIIHGSSLFKQVQEEREKALTAQKETEFLNEFAKTVNSSNVLEVIFSHATEELMMRFQADFFLLQLVEEKSGVLWTRCLTGEISKEDYNILTGFKIPLSSDSGFSHFPVHNKKTFYADTVQDIPESDFSEMDLYMKNILQMKGIFQIPLLVQNKTIGLMHINRIGGLKKISRDEIRFAEALCGQLAAAVNNSHLYELNETERQKSENLLLNILPKDVADELKEKGFAEPVLFENVSVMFTDFKGFTQIAEKLSPQELVKDLDACFVQFDKISERYNLEKLKTIGDSYMCAGGIPRRNRTHAIDCCLAALEIQDFMNLMKKLKEEKGFPYWELRLGIHSGPLVAGVIGERKFAYDVWGDTVNTASRMESSGTPGKINISGSVYDLVKDFFECEYRGRVSAKNKGEVDMHYVYGLRSEYSRNKDSRTPNDRFWEMYRKL